MSRRDYPTALAAGPEHGDKGLRDGLRWLFSQAREVGGTPLILVPTRGNIERNHLLSDLGRHPSIACATWRSPARNWGGGPVLAAWPTREKLGKIADDPRTRALVVIPWGEGEVDAWAAAAKPEFLGSAELPQKGSLDPVVAQGLKSLYADSNLAGSLDRRDGVAVLRTLKDGGYDLPPDAIYSWAIANGWQARGAERLRTLAAKFEAGKRPQLKGGYPFRADILDVWRRQAEEA